MSACSTVLRKPRPPSFGVRLAWANVKSFIGQPRMSSIALRTIESKVVACSIHLLRGTVRSPNDAVTHPQQVGGRLTVLEIDEFVDCRREATEKFLAHEVRYEVIASEGDS